LYGWGIRGVSETHGSIRPGTNAQNGREGLKLAILDEETRRAHKARNRFHSAMLLAGLAVLVAVPALLITGLIGLVFVAVMIAVVAIGR